MDQTERPKIFLADLSYINKGKEWTIIPFPLNVAYIAAYLQKLFPDKFEIKIFKDPEKFLDAITHQSPNVVGLSNYIWNRNLSLKFAKYVKELHPSCVTIMGGPNYNFSELDWVEQFMRKYPQIDFHIEGEGEVKFANVIKNCLEVGFNPDKVKLSKPSGVCYIEPNSQKCIIDTIPRLDALDDVPSPYLYGFLDEFLKDPNYCPIIETNRGCPYFCTFCDWGAMGKSKSAIFSMERVVKDLEYIVKHNVSKTPYLYIGDANFGLFKRDIEIAKMLRNFKDSSGFPQNVYLYFAKNSSESVLKIAELIKDMTNFSLSRQTQNSDVLKIIKRDNISIELFDKLAALGRKLGVSTFVELIYTLPGESKESFYNGVREILRHNVDGLHFFPSMLFDGAEMATNAYRKKHGLKGEWRFIDGCAGSYGPIQSMEFEEIITQTNVMTREDHMEIRLFHFIENWMIDSKIYKEIELLLGDVEYIDLIFDLMKNYKTAPTPFKELVDNFIADSDAEFINEPPADFTKDEIQSAIHSSVKLNPLYQAKLLYDPGVRNAFNLFLKERILKLTHSDEKHVDEILKHIEAKIYPFDGTKTRELKTIFDVTKYMYNPIKNLNGKLDFSDHMLSSPKTFLYRKRHSYQQFITELGDIPLSKKVYEICLHYTRESFVHTLTYSDVEDLDEDKNLVAEREQVESTRRIRLENGWVS